MKVYLDGQVYELAAGSAINRSPITEFVPNTRLTGQQARSDRTDLSSWVWNDWSGGMGSEIMKNPQQVKMYHYASMLDTRWPSHIYIQPAIQIPDIVPSRGDLSTSFEWLGNLYFVTELPVGTSHIVFKWFPGSNSLASYGNLYAIGSMAWGGSLSAIHYVKNLGGTLGFISSNPGENCYRWLVTATLGGTISVPADANGRITATYGVSTYPPQVIDMAGTLHVLTFMPNKISFSIGREDAGAPFDIVRVIPVMMGSYIAQLQTEGQNVYAQLPDGIYNFDLTPELIVSTERTLQKNGVTAMFRNRLHFAVGNSLMQYDGQDVYSVGYDRNDGLPFGWMGPVTAMVGAYRWLFTAVTGGSQYNKIMTMDENGIWQDYWEYLGANPIKEMFFSNISDGIDRMWVRLVGNNKPYYLKYPFNEPLSVASYPQDASGFIVLPRFDGDMFEEKAGFYDTWCDVDSPVDIINPAQTTFKYGLDGSLPNTNTLGAFTQRQALVFGSPYGAEGYTIQPELDFASSTPNYNSPQFRQLIIRYLKVPKPREYWDFTIDLKKTAKEWVRPVDDVLGSLSYLQNKRILSPFWYDHVATKNVRVVTSPSKETTEDTKFVEGGRTGNISLRVSEVI